MIIWIIGMSGAGKTTIGKKLLPMLNKHIGKFVFIDGDEVREIFGNDLSHKLEDRRKNANRIKHLCKLFDKNNINVVCCILSIFEETRDWNRKNLKKYKEIYIKVSMNELIRRDQKGLYKGALKNEIKNVVGFDIPFEEPSKSDIIIENDGDESIDDIVIKIMKNIN